MILAYGNRETQGNPISRSDLSWDIIALYQHINLDRSIGAGNRQTVHWTYNIQISVGLLPRNSGKLILISFNCGTHFIGTKPYDPENLPPSQTASEVWGMIMGNNL